MNPITDRVQREIELLSILSRDKSHRPVPLAKIHAQAVADGIERRRDAWPVPLAALTKQGALIQKVRERTIEVVPGVKQTVEVPGWSITAAGRRRLAALIERTTE